MKNLEPGYNSPLPEQQVIRSWRIDLFLAEVGRPLSLDTLGTLSEVETALGAVQAAAVNRVTALPRNRSNV